MVTIHCQLDHKSMASLQLKPIYSTPTEWHMHNQPDFVKTLGPNPPRPTSPNLNFVHPGYSNQFPLPHLPPSNSNPSPKQQSPSPMKNLRDVHQVLWTLLRIDLKIFELCSSVVEQIHIVFDRNMAIGLLDLLNWIWGSKVDGGQGRWNNPIYFAFWAWGHTLDTMQEC